MAPGCRWIVFYNGPSEPQQGDSWGLYWALRAINQGLFHALITALVADSQGLPDFLDSQGLPDSPGHSPGLPDSPQSSGNPWTATHSSRPPALPWSPRDSQTPPPGLPCRATLGHVRPVLGLSSVCFGLAFGHHSITCGLC